MSPTTCGRTARGPPVVQGILLSSYVGVVRAEITVDGALVAAVPHPSDPLTHFWDSTTVEPGWHELTVTVFDAMLNERSLSVQISTEPIPRLPGGRAGS